MNRIFTGSLCLSLALASTACLKTRAQLRGEGDEDARGGSEASQPQEPLQVSSYAVDELKSEISRLVGRIEDLERQNAQDAQGGGTRDEIKKLETRMTELEQGQIAALEAVKKMQSSVPPPDARELFEEAKASFDSGDMGEAIEKLSTYLKNPKGKHAEDATFLRAEAYFAQKDYKKAILDYSKFPEKFTKSKRVPSALYKIGLSFEALGMKEDARGFFADLVERFPKSAEAKKARSRLR